MPFSGRWRIVADGKTDAMEQNNTDLWNSKSQPQDSNLPNH